MTVGEKLRRGFNWADWLAYRWTELSGLIVAYGTVIRPTQATGLQYRCTAAGGVADSEPVWPTTIGATVPDGSAVWTAEALSVASLSAVINAAGDSTWAPPAPMAASAPQVNGQETTVLLDATNALADTTYDVVNTVVLSSGETKLGIIRVRVR